ncbi:(d)CMP kinase [Alicyclobacillus fastidiosus]|uniref:Cytidylate kinase n=1 Tax=Alicyclobacillus fastidiosus TaxID=392011 RepID=A0ABV5AB64_9BACL|nr:(d)CMP kinase [Alicyclobacillus fastidiosus]WEH11805.1 (d)CMP kinase [Alicyclobacillus fastidiosus]
MSPVSVAIDGPAGAGKSTVAKLVAERLKFLYIDTGAMYRAVAYLCVRENVDCSDTSAVDELVKVHDFRFEEGRDLGLIVYVDDQDVTAYLRSPDVSERVSLVAALPEVRSRLTQWQRAFAKTHSVVMDGRDIGTVVLPNATVKVFLTANVEERARRRQKEYQERGFDVSLVEIIDSMTQRDKLDSERELAPLTSAPDAVHIDSTGKPIDVVVDEIMRLVENAHVR